jgi:hypothetical protein
LVSEVQSLYEELLSRPATSGELSLALAFMTEQAVSEPDAQRRGASPLTQLAQALMLSNEFVFVD